ncbi:MAG: DUF1800 domain-containing protein [Fimbriimonadaceae bacterium]|nr:DUF1800 domain-containing protein [Fimbriimonadaceae bacterium]
MSVSRRELLRTGLLAGAAGALAGCGREARELVGMKEAAEFKLPNGPLEPGVRLLDRLAFGATAVDLKRLDQIGREAFVREQLRAALPEPLHLQSRIRKLEINQFQPEDLAGWPEEFIMRQLQQASILNAVYSPNQLRERMVDLWTNHFNIYARKGLAMYRIAKDQNEVIRKHALGKFRDLLRASARSPGMLAYLDNTVNRKGVANENYARELMELHSLGVHGGYSQQDVQEVARCFTGWGIEKRFLRPKGQFRFDPALHDDGEKLVLGQRIPAGGGEKDGDRVIDILAAHPACARFVSEKLCRYFLGTTETPWVERLAKRHQETEGDLRLMLEPLLLSSELLEAPPVVKRPFDFVVSSLRSLNATTDGGQNLQAHLEKMGQPLHQWPMPDGYPDKAAAWTGSLLARWNYALALTTDRIPGTRIDPKALAENGSLARLVLAGRTEPSVKTVARLSREPDEEAALALMTPEFQWR